jgi:hypothetical protein
MTPHTDLESQLREMLREQADDAHAHVDTALSLQRFKARLPRERRRGVFMVAGFATAGVAVVAALATSLVLALGGTTGRNGLASPGPVLPRPAPTIGVRALPPGAQVGATAARFTAPMPALVAGGALWIDDPHETRLTRVGLRDLHVLSSIKYAANPVAAQGVPTLAGSVVMLTQDDTLDGGLAEILRFDAATGAKLRPILPDSARAVTVTPVGVFAVVVYGQVGLVDPVRGRVTRSFPMPVDHGLAYASGLLWGWDVARSQLVGVDPATGKRVHVFGLPGFSDLPFLAAGPDRLVMAAPHGIALVDTSTGQVTAYTTVSPVNLVADGLGGLWGVTNGDDLFELDAASLATLRSYRVPGLDVITIAGDRLFAGERSGGRVRVYDLLRLRTG